MEKKDISVVHQLLTRYLKQFHFTLVMSQEVEYWFYPQENITDTFVVENANGEVTDFLSYFYMLPSTIINPPTHKSLKAAYSFYYVHTQIPLLDLMSDDALGLAKMKGFDMSDALELMENKTFLEKLKFSQGMATCSIIFTFRSVPSRSEVLDKATENSNQEMKPHHLVQFSQT
ncbi:hypothetical protein HJG60_010647 [Phyllostomus discolor]|uniref:Glycylpeptide N-tetradecanoyltransferase n=1 Tax=Phyllostomus discolor TaxID=89673 RepID=A0A834ANJ0_9CHIR|nr:hypothetical protein HJG60_010647 [Phyllostomus discolor]